MTKNITIEKCIRAFNNTSFDPEKRGKTLFDMFTEHFQNINEQIKDLSEEEIAYILKTFETKALNYINRRANTFSVMITGGSNFNTSRHEKASKSFHKAEEEYFNFINRSFKQIKKVSFEESILKLEEELEKAIQKHSDLKANPKKRSHMFSLTYAKKDVNNIKEKLESLKKIQDSTVSKEGVIKENKGFTAFIDNASNRIAIKHEEKPSIEERTKLKQNGFRWSPKNAQWQAFINDKSKRFIENYEIN
jgi:ribosomal protein S11